ncbi:glycosylhydrolase [gut metagenome]|uniref:Glycosylhydrolase n=1 Tax=gut metagenome TaxID=749906 RepID=J9GRD0_9ZZZZ
MKTMIYSLAMVTMSVCSIMACNDDDKVLMIKDWDGTTTAFSSVDEKQFQTYYKSSVGFVGDPMPFYDPQSGDFKIMYLQEFRPNQATYHPIWAVSTQDAASYTALGELIPTGTAGEADAAIGTGSTFYDVQNGIYYTYYTGHTAQEEVVMRATSHDFKTWTKDRTFYLKGTDYGYSKHDFRDPFVFQDEQHVYHMIVSTQLNGKGVLADFTSVDLHDWTHRGVFMTMMWDRFYECPDVFKMGEWWYLIYSEKHAAVRRVQYFKGHTLEELKACTANDAGIWPDGHEGFLDSRAFYAGKTASNGEERYIWGW